MRILFVCLLCFSIVIAQAQNTPTSADVNNAFTTKELLELIKSSAFEAVNEYNVPKEIFDINYAKIENDLLIKVRPAILKQTRWMLSTGGTSDKKTFKKQIYRGVRDVILFEPAFKTLGAVDQTDRILNYYSDIKVKKDGWLVVTEHITIYNGEGEQSSFYMDQYPDAERKVNNEIQHGLARDFPTVYQNKQGLNETVPFVVKSVILNDSAVNYRTIERENGVQVRIGNAGVYLKQGVFAYVITYETRNQLIFHPDKDELYWNVNGNGWIFSADSVSSKITFPSGAKIFDESCATGLQNSKERNCTSKKLNDSTIFFSANARLNANEGLTISASIQKGLLAPPSSSENFINLFKANWPLPAMIGVILFLFIINLRNWLSFGRDPKQGTIIPQFEPPNSLSPAAVGFIFKQGYNVEQFSAALVDIAVRKGITIDVGEKGLIFKNKTYTFRKFKETPELDDYISKSYDWSLDRLYGVVASKEYNPQVGSLNTKLSYHLSGQYQVDPMNQKKNPKGFFAWNAGAGAWGFFFLFILGFAALVTAGKFFTVTLAIIIIILFVLAFIMQYIFYKIMPAYTKEGRKVLDHILGFKMYLTTAEEKRFDQLNPPEKTLALFEKYLPYAIALECQSQWSDKFEKILDEAITNDNYHPTYYSGSNNMSFHSMSSGLSSGLSGAISSASTAPSSSSGGGSSSGGSSSGGGGGGGGGGGW